MIAAAWADGVVDLEEINCLKDLLFQLPGMTDSDWAELNIYIDTPVSEAERARLVAELQSALGSADDKNLALQTINQLVSADGENTGRRRPRGDWKIAARPHQAPLASDPGYPKPRTFYARLYQE